jgi:hypothetical protein
MKEHCSRQVLATGVHLQSRGYALIEGLVFVPVDVRTENLLNVIAIMNRGVYICCQITMFVLTQTMLHYWCIASELMDSLTVEDIP